MAREERKQKKVGQVWYLISIQWWNSWKSYISFKPSEENGILTEISGRSNSSDTRHRLLTQCKNPTGCLPWDDENVIMLNVNKTNSVCETALVGDSREALNEFNSNTFPRTSHSLTGTPKKYKLSPDVEQRTRSPSASPKLKKRVVIPPKPGQIDNNALVIPNQYKVCTLSLLYFGFHFV